MYELLVRPRGHWIWIGGALAVCALSTAVLIGHPEAPFVVAAAVLAGAAGLLALGYLLTHPFACLLAYCFFVPLEDLFVAPVVGSIPRMLGLILVVSYGMANWRRLVLNVLPGQAWLWFYWAILSFLWCWDQMSALDALAILAIQFLVMFLIADLIAHHSDRVPAVLWANAAGALVSAGLGLRNFLSGNFYAVAEVDVFSGGRASAFEGQDPSIFAGGMALGLLFLIYLLTLSRSRRSVRLTAGVLCLPMIGAILVSGTRSMWFGITAGAVTLLAPRLRLSTIMGLVPLVLVIGFMIAQFPGAADYLEFRLTSSLASEGAGRGDIWRVGAYMLTLSPVIGVGFGNFPAAFTYDAIARTPFEFRGFNQEDILIEGRASHNMYLQEGVEVGAIGLGLFLAWMFSLLRRPAPSAEGLLLKSVLVCYLVQGLTLDILGRKWFWLPVALLTAVQWAHRQGQAEAMPHSEP